MIIMFSAALVASACGGSGSPSSNDDGITIVASTTIWGDVAGSILGSDGTVQVLVPVGVDPHDYQLSSSQVADISRADLVIVNGFGLEENMVDVFAAAQGDGAVVLSVASSIDPIALGGDSSSEVCDPTAEVSGCDPHFWMDPDRASAAARAIAAALDRIDDSVGWLERADAYIETMNQAVVRMESALDMVPGERRKLVTNHDSLQYFAERFGFEVIATVIPGGSTLADPSSSDLADLVAIIRAEGISAIFADTTDSTALADAVAAELGEEVSVVQLFTGSVGQPGSGAETLIGMLEIDSALIAEALR
ncbi:MAG: metal ABC transporter substrate-binding protein [Actinomycetota bacterium]|nr:metal ABC transporter substrate-binding protein [Actinomycetota bacterium]